MLSDLLAAAGLVLIIEGLMPAVSPRGWRSMVEQVSVMSDQSLRVAGVVLIVIGAVFFHFVR